MQSSAEPQHRQPGCGPHCPRHIVSTALHICPLLPVSFPSAPSVPSNPHPLPAEVRRLSTSGFHSPSFPMSSVNKGMVVKPFLKVIFNSEDGVIPCGTKEFVFHMSRSFSCSAAETKSLPGNNMRLSRCQEGFQ